MPSLIPAFSDPKVMEDIEILQGAEKHGWGLNVPAVWRSGKKQFAPFT